MRVYMDYASTTPLHPEVIQTMTQMMQEEYGNPSSIHHHGRKSKAIIEEARKIVATLLNASIGEIFFTSSATEANNMALYCAVRDLGVTRIISSPTEHHCILHMLTYLEQNHGVTIEYLNVDTYGNINSDELKLAIENKEQKTLVSLMYINNETGTCLDINAVSKLCQEHDVLFHSDTVQGIGKLKIDLQETKLNFLCASGHKFYGPKGVGFIYVNGDNQIKSMLHGGSQERNMRAGTENVYGIAGLAKALELCHAEQEKNLDIAHKHRAYLKEGLIKHVPNISFLGNEDANYTPFILSALFPQSPKSSILSMNLDIKGISTSSGSACSSGVEQQSHVLKAMQVDPSLKPIRFSFSHHTTQEELDYILNEIGSII